MATAISIRPLLRLIHWANGKRFGVKVVDSAYSFSFLLLPFTRLGAQIKTKTSAKARHGTAQQDDEEGKQRVDERIHAGADAGIIYDPHADGAAKKGEPSTVLQVCLPLSGWIPS